jgi:opacity protein-like surface antigen
VTLAGLATQGVLNTSPLAVVVPPAVLTQAPANTTATGGSVIGGGYLGCNYQWMPFVVVGAEGDFNGAGLSATGHAQSLFGGAAAPGGSITWSSKLDSIATVRGRLGFAWTPNTLVYLTGGAAWGRTSYSSTDVFFFGCPACATTSFSNTSAGYVLRGHGMGALEQQLDRQSRFFTTTSAARPGPGSWQDRSPRRTPPGATWLCHRVAPA